AGRLDTRETVGIFGVELDNGDTADVTYASNYEFLAAPFRIAPGVVVPIGGYPTREVRANFSAGPQRRVEGSVNFIHGSFYKGTRTQAGYNGRMEITPQF